MVEKSAAASYTITEAMQPGKVCFLKSGRAAGKFNRIFLLTGKFFIMLQQQQLPDSFDSRKDQAAIILSAAGESHKGLARRKNEDNFCVAYSKDRKCLLAVVADGIGGHSRGEVASYICCRELVNAFLKNAGELADVRKAQKFLSDELEKINASIYLRNLANRGLKRPMGTTVNCVLFLPDFLVMGNAGDSRLYQLTSGDELKQLSTDHSFKAVVASLEQKTKNGGMDNVIYRAVGLHRNFELELKAFPLIGGTKYFICTDGMYRSLTHFMIEEGLRGAKRPKGALDIFMRSALVGGGKDNITGIVVFAGEYRNE